MRLFERVDEKIDALQSFLSRVLRLFFGGKGKSGNKSRRMEDIGIRGCRDRLRSSISSADNEMTSHDWG